MTDAVEQKSAEHKAAEQKKQDKRPDVQIVCNQAFIFMEGDGSQGKRAVVPSQPFAQTVPAWVTDTATYKNGISDKTIIQVGTAASKEESDEENGGKSKPADDKGHKAGLQK